MLLGAVNPEADLSSYEKAAAPINTQPHPAHGLAAHLRSKLWADPIGQKQMAVTIDLETYYEIIDMLEGVE